LQMFDLTFDLSVMSYLIPLCVGACVYTVPEKGTKYTNVYSILESHAITFALMVPSILSFLKPYFEEITLPQLRYSLFCGEALFTGLATGWMKCAPNARIENVYGPTEATIFCLTYSVGNTEQVTDYNGIVAIGKPMTGLEVMAANEFFEPIKDGDKGELCLCGGQVTNGYLDPENDKAAFFELNGKKYYRTGDIVYKDSKGDYLYCGRADQQVKIQGFRVELSEIEFHLKNITGNRNLVALALSNSNDIVQVEVAFEGEEADMSIALQQLTEVLPHYMLPSAVHFVSSFPLNSNGKTDKKELRNLIANKI